MVAMGGGPEVPTPAAGKSRGVLLAVLPWAEGSTEESMKKIQAQFPDLETHYVHHILSPEIVKEKGKGLPQVPEGNDQLTILDPLFLLCHQSRQ
jgi:hypothetical protein